MSLTLPARATVERAPPTGERVMLTPLDQRDVPHLYRLVEGSRWHLERWLPWVPFNDSLEASERYVAACIDDWDNGRAARFGVRARPGGQLLGVVGLDSCVHLHRSCDLGYWLRHDATGKGLMTEAARLAVAFALDTMKVHRIRCAAATDNHPSLRVIARLGFSFEGIARHAEYVASRWVDHAVFALIAES